MAQPTNTFDKYDAVGAREDLGDIIFDVSPDETPILSAMKKSKASNTLHEWQTDALAAAAANAAIEGDDASAAEITATTRLNNQTQIIEKSIVISGTQEKGMNNAGRASELAYQTARALKNIKLDAEFAMLDNGIANGVGNAKVAGNATTAREMASLGTYLISNTSHGTNGAVATGDGSDLITTGTDRDLDEAHLTAILSSCYTSGGNPSLLAVSATNKGRVSGFTGGGTRYVDTDDKKLVNSIDVYVGDFHTLKVVPCRQLVGDNVYAIDPEYLACSELRPAQTKELGATGDNFKKQMLWEVTLEVCNEAAHGMICDTNG